VLGYISVVLVHGDCVRDCNGIGVYSVDTVD
jgi:hypothetical protein